MSGADRPPSDETGRERLLPGSSSLAILLVVFLTLSLLILFSIMRGGAGHVADDAGGRTAYSPADFPEIEFDRPLLEEVEAAGAAVSTDSIFVELSGVSVRPERYCLWMKIIPMARM